MTIRNLRTHDAPFVTVAELAAYVRLTTRMIYKEIDGGEWPGPAVRAPWHHPHSD